MLWNRLSTFTDQLTQITKEVIDEGAEEVDKVSVELKEAHDQINELRVVTAAQKAEVSTVRVKLHQIRLHRFSISTFNIYYTDVARTLTLEQDREVQPRSVGASRTRYSNRSAKH